MNRVVRFNPLIVCGLCHMVFVSVDRAQAEFETPIAVTHVSLLSEDGTLVSGATIVMEHGRFTDIGVDAPIPAHARVIDGTGLFAYPGFVDAQTHMGLPATARETDRRRLTEDKRPDPTASPLVETRGANRRGIRPQFRAIERFVPDGEALKAHREGGFTAALIAPRDGIFSGSSDVIELNGAPIRRVVLAEHVAMHGSFSTGEDGAYPQTLLGVFASFRQTLYDAAYLSKLRSHAERHPRTSKPAPLDPALEALRPMLAARQRVFLEASTEREILRAVSLADEFGFQLGLSGAKEAWKVADLIKRRRIPLIVSIKFDPQPEHTKGLGWVEPSGQHPDEEPEKNEESKGGEKDTASLNPDRDRVFEPLRLSRERKRLWDEQVENVVRLHEAGIPFALRTRDFKKLGDFAVNLRMVMARGLPEHAAVAALTSTPASMFGLADQLGAVQRHYLANLTLLDHPINAKDAKAKYVFIAGEVFDLDPYGDREKKNKKESQTKAHAVKGDKTATTDGGGATATPKGKTPESKTPERPVYAVEIEADRIPTTQTGGNVLIQNATIIPVTSPTLPKASILIVEGVIAAIGETVEAPAGVTILDGSGWFVMPGLIDAHSHLGLDAVNEGPLAISAEVRIADVINPTSVGIFRAVAGGTTTHHALHGSANPVGGQNAILKLKYGRSAEAMLIADAPRTIKFATGENVKQSNNQMAWGKRFPNSRMGVASVFRAAFEGGLQYRDALIEYDRKSRAGMDLPPIRRDLRLEALADIVRGDLAIHAHCYRSDEILGLLAVAEEYGVRVSTLQHVLEGYRIAPEIARHGCGASTFSNFWAYKIEAYGAVPYNAAMLTRNGVCTTVNSDSPNTIRYLAQEAAKSIRWGGLDETQTLKLVTINAARQLQLEDRIGSLEVGKDGDLAIFNGHPLNTFSRCVMTLIEGEVYFEDRNPLPTEPCATLHHPGAVDQTIPATVHKAYAIVGATVHPISGPAIEHATVVTVDDRIYAVGVGADVPPGAGVIDGTGLHVYPGLIDGGNTIGLVEIGSLKATRDNREIGAFNPHLTAYSAIHPHSEHIRITRVAGTTTALSKPTGGKVAGQSAIIHLDGWTARDMVVDSAFGLHVTVPSLPVHLPHDKEKKKKLLADHKKAKHELESFFDKARLYEKVAALAQTDSQISYEKDFALEAMRPYVRGDKPVLFSAARYKSILDSLDFAEHYSLKAVIAGGRESWKLAETLAKNDVPVILGTPLSYPSGRFEPWDSVYRCAFMLDQAGVRFCFASESYEHAYDLGLMAGMAVAHGLPKARAEYALTLGAAEILGIDDRFGSIKVGKVADLIVTTDSPLQAACVVTHMFIQGTPVPLTSMHTEAVEKFSNRPAPHLPAPPDLIGPPNLTTHLTGAHGTKAP